MTHRQTKQLDNELRRKEEQRRRAKNSGVGHGRSASSVLVNLAWSPVNMSGEIKTTAKINLVFNL